MEAVKGGWEGEGKEKQEVAPKELHRITRRNEANLDR